MIKVAILTVSDSCQRGEREDVSGPTIAEMLPQDVFETCEKAIVADDRGAIADEIVYFADEAKVELVFTTGGTGLGPRDVTPEATGDVCDRLVPGLSETIRAEGLKKVRSAILSRGIAAVRGQTLVINLPGSPKGVRESLEAILDIVPHAAEMMRGGGH